MLVGLEAVLLEVGLGYFEVLGATEVEGELWDGVADVV